MITDLGSISADHVGHIRKLLGAGFSIKKLLLWNSRILSKSSLRGYLRKQGYQVTMKSIQRYFYFHES